MIELVSRELPLIQGPTTSSKIQSAAWNNMDCSDGNINILTGIWNLGSGVIFSLVNTFGTG